VHLISDPKNGQDSLGNTAYYDPSNFKVVLYTDGRHIKDILRSFAHELIHHKQNCEGNLGSKATPEGYAQKDSHLRKMELEAYKDGNINFRDWEDKKKNSKTGANKMNEQMDEKVGTLVDMFNIGIKKYKENPSYENYMMLNDIAIEIENIVGIGANRKGKTVNLVTRRIWQRTREIEQDRLEKGLPVTSDDEDPFGTRDPTTGEDPMQKKFRNKTQPSKGVLPYTDPINESKWDNNDNEDFDEWLSKERQIVHSERLGVKMNLDNLGKNISKKKIAKSMGVHKEVIDKVYNDKGDK
jgi:hypothetical protein